MITLLYNEPDFALICCFNGGHSMYSIILLPFLLLLLGKSIAKVIMSKLKKEEKIQYVKMNYIFELARNKKLCPSGFSFLATSKICTTKPKGL